MNETARQASWFDKRGKFKGWPKGVPHGPRKRSPWGDLSGRLNRQRFQNYLHNLADATRFTHSLKGLILYRGLSVNVRAHIRKRLAEIDPDGLRLLHRLNKAMTRAQNANKEFDPGKILAEDRTRRSKRLLERLQAPPAPSLQGSPQPEPKPKHPQKVEPYPCRWRDAKHWDTNLLQRARPLTPAELRRKNMREVVQRYG